LIAEGRAVPARRDLQDVLREIGSPLELTPEIRRAAAALQSTWVRSLDAIHVATAASLGADLAGLLTYDVRMQQAGWKLGSRLSRLADAQARMHAPALRSTARS
jgi:predicted nucleic acid-binding protein